MTRHQRFTRMLGADLPSMPWLAVIAGLWLGRALDDPQGPKDGLATWAVGIVLLVCIVWLIAFTLDVVKRLGAAITRWEERP